MVGGCFVCSMFSMRNIGVNTETMHIAECSKLRTLRPQLWVLLTSSHMDYALACFDSISWVHTILRLKLLPDYTF
jgi:hypothetical protein